LYLIILYPKNGYPISEFDIKSFICNLIGLLISIILFQLKVLNNYNNINYYEIIIPIWILSSIGNIIHIFGIINRIRKPDCCKLFLAIILPSINIYTICIFLTLLSYYFDNINTITGELYVNVVTIEGLLCFNSSKYMIFAAITLIKVVIHIQNINIVFTCVKSSIIDAL
jgi:hypothetical protein